MRYRDRSAAGAALAAELSFLAPYRPVVLGLVRGGVPVAAEVARSLGLPLDALVVRKLGLPASPELAFGALGPNGVRVLNEQISARLTPAEIDAVVRAESAELARRERLFRAGRPALDLTGGVALLVDDGLATGATARVAVAVARELGATRVVFAVPVGGRPALDQLARVADRVICPLVPRDFAAVSQFYDRFPQVTDAEVEWLLDSVR
jgi:putative phosphoribosyl transferase